ncbi:MAG: hypothetical protein HY822_18215 [Acidobacteria bacterium]|nr:hypothetical protein [Acidobacteriota bacterium]
MPQQVVRLGLVFALLIAALLSARWFLVPKTFGQAGHYRAAAVDDVIATKVRYAWREACPMCHPDVAGKNQNGRHRAVACEVCHGAAQAHADAPEKHPAIPRQRKFCAICHAYDAGRPTGFPQIDSAAHNPAKSCLSCHNPHAPETPRPPDSCGACHGLIARTHVVSNHASIACTQCHETPKQHRVEPLVNRPSKPATREFCGQCHASDAKSSKEIPRVDLAAHGERRVCWECHYPHFPEAK